MTGISMPRSISGPPGWRCLPAELASDLPGTLPGRAAGGETGTPAGDRRNPRPSGRREVKVGDPFVVVGEYGCATPSDGEHPGAVTTPGRQRRCGEHAAGFLRPARTRFPRTAPGK